MTRSLVFFAPLLTFGIPELHVSGLALLAAIGPTVLAMAFGWANIRLGLSSRMVEMLGPLGSMDRARDLIYFFSGGAAQEYLYRWVVFVAFTPLLDWVVIPLSVLLFVGEHVLHAVARSTWDARDVVVHAVLGTVYAAVMYLTGSWLAVAIAHTVYNLPNVVQTLLRPSIPKRQPVPVA
ncbi:CPBP family intramembrane glutamic endopeptidase [Blastococcus sp. TF02A_35]|uniref:CPBP family intramembrane glutamic endopeptidase n=1 Tax=Blastococcus sp. TF02A-35 TaxID=2559612 RepID=UPI001073DA3F|nr:CPBP family intramembrane glutamic endopeptidase [Blastococcus sp. TF02A_35]TFV52072.1 CPBP family intramembrane metalloprotease [Blastococcus sp. TF02A_35]